ncbi:MAG: S46 family peptidase [Prevotellaceae bacterium]|nr:S46 family peptidase [Prevotellaceae bacterium]
MKKSTILLAGLLAFSGAKADEGMWTLYNLPQAVYEQMQVEGFKLPYNDLYYGADAVKNTVVNFSGYCSGVVVSPEGLVFTNHHCGFEAIRSHSTVEHDYMLNGFLAKSYEEELPNKDMFVSFMIEQKDITPRMKQLGIDAMNFAGQARLIDSIQTVLTDSVKRINKSYHVEVDAFYEGNSYYATTYQQFNDLRLVFTVPKSMGKFGGETDNWMWPRQTCDYSVFRIYADPKTNGPADYSENNVPYKPKHWAPISMEGYKEGDFAMTMGYPGTTHRYLSSYGIRQMRDAENAPRAQVRGVKQAIMVRHMRADEAVRIKYDSKYAQSSNYWKNALGMNKCIDSIGIIGQKRDYERKIADWMAETGLMKGQLDFDRMKQLYDKQFETVKAMTYFRESFIRNNEFCTRAVRVLTGLEPQGPSENPNKMYFQFADNSEEWDDALDKEVFIAMLKNYKEQVNPAYLPDFYKVIANKFNNNYEAYVNYLYSKSDLMKKDAKMYFNKKKFKNDPGVQLGMQLLSMYETLREAWAQTNEMVAEQEKHLCAAKLRMEEDMPHYSDANFTMRLSYGQVGGFELAGAPSGYYTTAESIVEKMDKASENVEYYAEPVMRELLSAKDFGPYTDKTTGKMQLCFLTNNDITGGNSGSPMFGDKGQLIGLAFDGNWDSLSSDINFDKRLARCIGVDIRYVIFLMDKWGHADRLLKEMNLK